MKKNCSAYIVLLGCCFFISGSALSQRDKIEQQHTLIFMFDGLRPDYITPEQMPNLYAFRQKWSYGKDHHSIFPTVTRVNSSSYSTGSYPAKHGILGNTVFFPEVDPVKGLNTGDAADLNKIDAATQGNLLTAVSLGEILQKAGKKMYVFSSGSTGQALLQNHKVSGGAIINPEMILPASFKTEVIATIGQVPPHGEPNTSQHHWVVDAFLHYGAKANGPDVSAIWLSDPDGTAHNKGIGSAEAVNSIKIVDMEFGRIIDSLAARGLDKQFNILIATDHGFVTNVNKGDAIGTADLLVKNGLKQSQLSDDVVIAEGAVYVKDHNPEKIRKIVTLLQQQQTTGAIFTKAAQTGDQKGWVPGTLSFDLIHWNHPQRAADILVSRDWSDDLNDKGYAGVTFSRGVAGHGGSSKYEFHIPLIVGGPAFKTAFTSSLPTANIDIVPTVLTLHGLPVPDAMDGRVLTEFMIGKKSTIQSVPRKEKVQTEVQLDGFTYRVTVEQVSLGKYRYINYAKAERNK
jgi:predicted AlkP superfamily pyrophosphatase or phosphodiesterase